MKLSPAEQGIRAARAEAQKEMNDLKELIKQSNQEVRELYPSGVNHKGFKLTHYYIYGLDILAFTESHAENIYRQSLIDLNLI